MTRLPKAEDALAVGVVTALAASGVAYLCFSERGRRIGSELDQWTDRARADFKRVTRALDETAEAVTAIRAILERLLSGRSSGRPSTPVGRPPQVAL